MICLFSASQMMTWPMLAEIMEQFKADLAARGPINIQESQREDMMAEANVVMDSQGRMEALLPNAWDEDESEPIADEATPVDSLSESERMEQDMSESKASIMEQASLSASALSGGQRESKDLNVGKAGADGVAGAATPGTSDEGEKTLSPIDDNLSVNQGEGAISAQSNNSDVSSNVSPNATQTLTRKRKYRLDELFSEKTVAVQVIERDDGIELLYPQRHTVATLIVAVAGKNNKAGRALIKRAMDVEEQEAEPEGRHTRMVQLLDELIHGKGIEGKVVGMELLWTAEPEEGLEVRVRRALSWARN